MLDEKRKPFSRQQFTVVDLLIFSLVNFEQFSLEALLGARGACQIILNS